MKSSKPLRLASAVIGRAPLPGRFVAADLLSKLLAPDSGFAERTEGGYVVEYDLRDEIQRQMYFGIYEQPLVCLLRQRLQAGGVFYDVGANVGYFTLLASSLVGSGGEVHAFEPVPNNAARIKRNLGRNNIANVFLNELAVAEGSGTLTLYLPGVTFNSGWASLIPSSKSPQQISVPTISLDEYVFDQGHRFPDVVKIDIEGAEPQALAGMRRILARDPSPDLVAEINPYLLNRAGLTAADTLGPLRAAGYRLFRLRASDVVPLTEDPPSDSKAPVLDVFASKRQPPELR
jgi:FkbM family methyltransferase